MDDAAGEAFDKVAARLRAGPAFNAAKTGNPKAYRLPVPMWTANNVKFSGLKTAVLNEG